MSEVKASFSGPREPRAPAGLVDGGRIILSCSNCRKPVADVQITRPDKPIEWRVRALCPYCGDKSYVHTVKGMFACGGHWEEKESPENVDDVLVLTKIAGQQHDSDADGNPILTFKMVQA